MEAAETCPAIGILRVTGIAFDPTNRLDIWVGLEVDGVRRSTDGGATWRAVGIRDVFPYTYPRGIMFQPGQPSTVFLTTGDTIPGRTGTVMRSRDTGKTWESLSLPVQPNTAMWVVNVQPFEPQVVFAGSRYGYLYRSDNGGDS